MADFTIVRSLKRSAEAAEHQAEQYRRVGRHDDADDAAKDGRRWRMLADRAPALFAEQDCAGLAATAKAEVA
jgi:hypothetical protein